MKKILKALVIYLVDKLALHQEYSFPATFIWKWKLSYLTQTYEHETTLFFKKHIKPGMCVVDVGANLGYYTRIFSKLVGEEGKVFSFEADDENFSFLQKNTEKLNNVVLNKVAVTDKSGFVDFYHHEGATGTHSIVPILDAEKRMVESVSLDDFFKNEGYPDFIKIDVEGAEKSVFKGMSNILQAKPVVVFEYQKTVNDDLIEDLSNNHKIYSINSYGTKSGIDEINFKKGKVQYANLCLDDNDV